MSIARAYTGMKSPLEVRAAIYCRLSKDDDITEGESASIQNQKILLEQYCEQQGWEIVAVYQDDGYTGLNMNRPDLQRMLRAIERKQIDLVITKDLSRLGRNYLETGRLLEEFFPRHGVRYIALNDSVDSDKENNDIAPFKNILNEFYSRDVSKKVHSSYLTKAKTGQFTGCLAPFGYKKSPENRNQLIIDEDTAWIVRRIFEYARNGHGPNYIRRKLEQEEIPAPVWWNRQKGLRNKKSKFEIADPERGRFMWDFTTIKEILSNPVYIGAIASQKTDYRFKTGWIKDKKPEEWIVVEDMHEPIIDRETYEIVQSKVRSRKRPDAWGNFGIFAGLLKCGQCGSAMNVRITNSKAREKIFTCSKYNKYGVAHCSQHRIKYDVLYGIVLEQIRHYARLALTNEQEVAKELMSSCSAEEQVEKELIQRGISEDSERAGELDKLITRLYQDMVAGRITEGNFERILQTTQAEQETLQKRLKLNRERLDCQQKEQADTSKWVTLIKEYADIQELDATILNQLINKIVVHEDIDGAVVRQTVEIHFNFMRQADKYKLIRQ